MMSDSAKEIVARARKAFESGKTKDINWRLAQLKQLHKLLSNHQEDIIEAERKDLRKPGFETTISEIVMARSETAHAINNLSSWSQPTYVSRTMTQALDSVYTKPEPYGVVLIMGAWNYPTQLLLLPLVGAIAAGNCAVLKASEIAPNTADLMAKLIPQYLDKDCFPVYQGAVLETTELLKEKFNYIFFTGNKTVGKIVMAAAAKHLTPVTLELGGKCPAYIHKSSNLDIVASRLCWGKFLNGGQTCVSPDYVLCDAEIRDEFITAFTKKIEERYGKDPQKSPDLTRIVNERHFKRLKSLLDKIPKEKVVFGGKTDEHDLYIEPTIVKDCTLEDSVMSDELFGPILPVISVDKPEEAVATINSLENPLALYVFSNDKQIAEYIMSNTSSGGVTVNDTLMHMTAVNLPFGGVGPSGMGGYHGKFTFNTFSHQKPVCHRKQNMEALLAVRYPPYTNKKMNQAIYLMEEKTSTRYCIIM